MSARTADRDLLLKTAEEIHAIGETLRASAGSLRRRSQDAVSSSESDIRTDTLAAAEWILSLSGRIGRGADFLAALAAAARQLDDESVEAFLRMRGEEEFIATFFPAAPDVPVPGFEPYYLPRVRMVCSDWAPVYVPGKAGLTQTDTYHTGRILARTVGRWTNPNTRTVHCVFVKEDDAAAFVPDGKLGPAIDVSGIPDRPGDFAEGQRGPVSPLWIPPDDAARKGEWRRAGDPWQNFILGNMRVNGLEGAVFPAVPHANLCGELSVFFAVGEPDLEAGFSRFARLQGLGYWNLDGAKTEYNGTQVLQNPGHATSSYDLKRLFEEYGWTCAIRNGTMPMPDELAGMLQSGARVVYLAELDTRTKITSRRDGLWIDNPGYGRLVSGVQPHASGLAAHWVAVTDVFQDGQGTIRVTVWNTYTGCEETYSWESFSRSGRNPGASAGSYTFLEAEQAAEAPPDANSPGRPDRFPPADSAQILSTRSLRQSDGFRPSSQYW